MQRGSVIRTTRIVHRYLGLFFAPSILFFALSGAFQVLGWHQTRGGANGEPARWIAVMAQLHKKQSLVLPDPKPKKEKNRTDDPSAPKKQSKAPASKIALKVFVLAMSVALAVTTLLGILMALLYGGDWRVASVVVLLGIVFPIAVTVL